MVRILIILCFFYISISAIQIDSYLPKFKEYSLENGLKVLIAQDNEQPIFQMKMALDIGVFYDPVDKEGLTKLTNTMLRKGSHSRTSEDFSQEIEFIGGSLGVSTGFESSTISCAVLSTYSDQAIDMFQDMILNPIFPENELSLLKVQFSTDIKENASDNKFLSKLYTYYALMGDSHPQARTMSISTITSLSREDLIDWYKRFYQPQNARLYVISDQNPDDVFQKINLSLSKWSNNEFIKPELITPIFNDKKRLIVDKPEMTQGFISFISPAIKRNSKDYAAFILFNDIFGSGRFSSRLMQAVRVKGGKSYGAGAVLEPRLRYGLFRIATFTRLDEIQNTIDIIEKEINDIVSKGISEEELKRSKDYILGSLSLRLESPSSQLSYLMYQHFYGLDVMAIQNELNLIKKITIADVNQVIKKYLSLDTINKIILTDGKESDIPGYSIVSFKTLLKDI